MEDVTSIAMRHSKVNEDVLKTWGLFQNETNFATVLHDTIYVFKSFNHKHDVFPLFEHIEHISKC